MSILGREAETSKFHLETPGASGKLASKGMFRILLDPSWPGGHKFIPDDYFLNVLDRGQAGGRKL